MKRGPIIIIVVAVALVLGIFIFFNMSAQENLFNENEADNLLSDEEDSLAFEEGVWQERIDAAFAPYDCPPVVERQYPDTYYKGPIIDAHIHVPNIPDASTQVLIEELKKEDGLNLGVHTTITQMVCTFSREGTKKVFAFFPVYPELPKQMTQVVYETMQKYPDKFVPFIMTPDNDNSPFGYPTVDAETLKEMLAVYPDLFEGYGEIGLYARRGGGAKELPPDSQRLLEIYPIVRENNLVVYFHLGEDHQESFENILDANPDINFIWHGDQLVPYENGIQNLQHIGEILNNHPNVYYEVDELYGDDFILRPEVNKENFLAHFDNYEPLLDEDIETWGEFIVKHQDQVIWGTDRGWSSAWSLDYEAGEQLTDYARAFIGRLPPEVQEKYAYKNAEKLLT